ncbi:MAG: flagellar motor protein MotB [Lautropia sp.]|nr:flagellar motor protein MotB [Lautropia sp.]
MSSANAKKTQPIVIKRIKKGGHGHHGGAWKIAYADFVTAMMAFFLLMWLLSSASENDLKGISEYFQTPLKIALSGGSGVGDRTAPVPGGGMDLTRKDGQVNRKADQGRQRRKQEEEKALMALQQKLEESIIRIPALEALRDQIKLEMTVDGLSIQIVDASKKPLFASGKSTVLSPAMRELLRTIGKMLNDVENSISLSGHTDATPYAGGAVGGYSNWELSAERANSSRREMVLGGMDAGKVLRVQGLGSVMPIEKDNPRDPVNRRIAIVVLNDEAKARILGGTEIKASDEQSAAEALGAVQILNDVKQQ